MPPDVPDEKRSIALATHGQLQEIPPDEAVVGFYTMDGASAGLLSSAFDIKEEISTIVGLVRHPDPRIKANGLRLFRAVLRDIAKANGIIGKFQEMQTVPGPDGEPVKRVLSTNTLLTRMSRETNSEQHTQRDGTHLEHRPAAVALPGDAEREEASGELGPRHDDESRRDRVPGDHGDPGSHGPLEDESSRAGVSHLRRGDGHRNR